MLVRTGYLESPHIPGIPRVLQTILVAFQEEFQEKSEQNNKIVIQEAKKEAF